MKILRLLLFEDCNRKCEGCCNKQFDLKALPKFDGDFSKYDQVLLTGGEPMLRPDIVIETAKRVPRGIPVYVYTADVTDIDKVLEVLDYVDGLTVTLHEDLDAVPFLQFNMRLLCGPAWYRQNKSLRLNVFAGTDSRLQGWGLPLWQVKRDIEWINPCPLPAEEVFMRL